MSLKGFGAQHEFEIAPGPESPKPKPSQRKSAGPFSQGFRMPASSQELFKSYWPLAIRSKATKHMLTSASSLQAIRGDQASLPVLCFFRSMTGISLENKNRLLRGVVVVA